MAEVFELKSDSHNGNELHRRQEKHDRDDQVLVRLGKVPVLKRNFGFISMLAFSSSVMLSWETVLAVLSINLTNGGIAGSIYGYIFVWVGSLAAYCSVAELASMAPTAAGQYQWVSILAPKSHRVVFSYIIGWLTVIAWQASCAASGFLTASLTEGLVILAQPEVTFQPWQTLLIYWASILFSILVNTVIARYLPALESVFGVLHIVGFLAVLIPLVYFGPHSDAETVFTSFANDGNWSTQGLSFMVGLTGPIYAILGVDSGIHMSEEIENPQRNVPRVIVFGVLVNGALGFAMLIAVLFCLGDLDTVLQTPTGEPYMAIFQQAVGNVGGATTMAAISVVIGYASGASIVASASRITWSFARDRGLPGWRLLSTVEPRTTLPLWSIGLTNLISILLSFIVLGSSLAFNDVVSVTIGGIYAAFLIVISLLLWRRVTGQIQPYSTRATLMNTTQSDNLTWGPWRVPEPWGTIVNAFGCMYLLTAQFFTYWPVTSEPDAAGMNYSCLLVGVSVIFAGVYYAIWGRKSYTGPVVEVIPSEETSAHEI